MTEKTQEQEKDLDALREELASLRKELAGLASDMKNGSGGGSVTQGEDGQAAADSAGADGGEQGGSVWTDFLHQFSASRAQGEKAVRELVAEVERHPLVGITAAFGLGFIIAKLWDRGRKQ